MRKSDAIISDYTAAPIYFNDNKNAAHEWLIEFTREPKDMDVFNRDFDQALQLLNSDYEAKRYKNMVLGRPVIRSLPGQTFYNWLKNAINWVAKTKCRDCPITENMWMKF